MFTKLRNNISQMQMIALGFFCIILIGTLLLMTSLASKSRNLDRFSHCTFYIYQCYLRHRSGRYKYLFTLVAFWSDHHYYSDPDWRTWFYYLWIRIFHVLAKEDHLAATRTLKGKCQCREHRRIVRLARLILQGTLLFEGIGALNSHPLFSPGYAIFTGALLWYFPFHLGIL